MWPNPQIPADLVTFTEEILNGKLHFLCSVVFYAVYDIDLFCTSAHRRIQSTQASKVKCFGKIVNCYSAKHFILDVWQGSEYTTPPSFILIQYLEAIAVEY